MSNVLEELCERIRGEVPELGRAVDRALRAWGHAQRTPGEYAYLDSVALNLHGFYSGVERLFELIARHVDRTLSGGDTWHRDLLYQMADDLPDARPAVVSHETAQALDEFRRFRHVVRRVYTINLAPEKMASLMSALPPVWARCRPNSVPLPTTWKHWGDRRRAPLCPGSKPFGCVPARPVSTPLPGWLLASALTADG